MMSSENVRQCAITKHCAVNMMGQVPISVRGEDFFGGFVASSLHAMQPSIELDRK
jgi:hypothetical protein